MEKVIQNLNFQKRDLSVDHFKRENNYKDKT